MVSTSDEYNKYVFALYSVRLVSFYMSALDPEVIDGFHSLTVRSFISI